MSKIFKSDYLGGIILEHLYNNADKKFTLNEFEKLYGKNELPYIMSELAFIETEGLITRFELPLQNIDTGEEIRPLSYYRISHKGYSYINGLQKDRKALRNSIIAIFLSVAVPLTLFVAGKWVDYYLKKNNTPSCAAVSYSIQSAKNNSASQGTQNFQVNLPKASSVNITDSSNQHPKN